MATQNNQRQTDDDQQSLSRSAYRAQKRKEQAAFEQRDRERLKAETRYARQHTNPQYDPSEEEALVSQKVNRLKRRLNWAILGLSLAIVATFLVLFFVEF
ncbi:hypothetical protein GM612_09625 [Lactobacillus sp. CRM56-3]|uniref:Uncharacterized protein n=1 Tax=Secundilactobacillus folii TaxID=2678357 RepID=A0A7X3C415_9LACO|nr:hypothetical protein [Secundilactobacillus folii]